MLQPHPCPKQKNHQCCQNVIGNATVAMAGTCAFVSPFQDPPVTKERIQWPQDTVKDPNEQLPQQAHGNRSDDSMRQKVQHWCDGHRQCTDEETVNLISQLGDSCLNLCIAPEMFDLSRRISYLAMLPINTVTTVPAQTKWVRHKTRDAQAFCFRCRMMRKTTAVSQS